jgi:flagellar FliL protein
MISLYNKSLILCLLLLSCFISNSLYAEDDENPIPTYIELTPNFVVNHIGGGSKLKYIKTSISIRTNESQKILIENNMPLVRDALVMFLSSRTVEQVTGAIAREATRKEGAMAVNNVLKEETGLEPVTDILFSSFVTQ